MIQKIDQIWWYKLNGALRKSQVTGPFSGLFNNLVITEYPKSGGTWLSQLLAEATSMPYPRSRLPMLRQSIMHGCFLDLNQNKKTVVLMRDGRDVMVSYYFHLLMHNPLKSTAHVNKVRNHLKFKDTNDSVANLPQFIEYCFSRQVYPRFTWAEFVNRWLNTEGVVHTSYEQLQVDTPGELKRIIASLGDKVSSADISRAVDRFSFQRMAELESALPENRRFARKGVVGDWVNHFSTEAIDVFEHFAGTELRACGYK